MRYKINDIVKIVKEDEYIGQEGIIVNIRDLTPAPVTIFYVMFNDGKVKYYFYNEIK